MHLYIKKLNNKAASYIELGEHDQAIEMLKKALHLIKQSSGSNFNVTSKTTTKQVCCCNYCSLNECMVYSEENAPFDLVDNDMGTETTTLPTTSFPTNIQEADDRRDDYIHRRPIHVTPKHLLEENNLGPFLSLLVLFNLALAHHLKFVSIFILSTNSNTATTNSATVKRLALRKVLRLYELTYKLQTDLIANERHQLDATLCTNTSENVADPGLRFSIIICNNLSQVHKTLQNQEKQSQCLRKLLSMLMYVVDLEHETYSSSIDEEEYSQVASISSSPLTMSAFLPISRRRRGRKWLFMDLDGFLQNTVPIILQDNCAMVA